MASVTNSSSIPSFGHVLPREAATKVQWWINSIVACLLFAVVFINAADFRGDTGEEFAVHWQIHLRLLVCAACGSIALLLLHQSLSPFFTFPGMLIAAQIAWALIACIQSIDRTYSIVALVSLGSVVLLTPAAMRMLGGFRFLLIVGAGLVTFLLGSWVAYIAFPHIGVFNEQISNTEVFPRMGGLGHPNELGFYSACTVVLFAALHYCRRLPTSIAGAAVLLGLATVITCFSRTSIILMIIGLLVVYRREIMTEKFVLLGLIIGLILIPSVAYFYATGELDWIVAESLDKISKSGSSDELTTGTGRTEIWAYAIQKIGEQPLFGYGYGTARFVMVDHSFHCHNIFLNYCMASGILAGMMYLGLAMYLLYAMWVDPRPEIDGLLILILVGGLAEGLLISPVPTTQMLVFLAGTFWRQLDMNIERDRGLVQPPGFGDFAKA